MCAYTHRNIPVFPIWWFTSQMAPIAGVESAQTQEPGTPLGSPRQVAGTQTHGYCLSLSRHNNRGGLEADVQELKCALQISGAQAVSGLAHCVVISTSIKIASLEHLNNVIVHSAVPTRRNKMKNLNI